MVPWKGRRCIHTVVGYIDFRVALTRANRRRRRHSRRFRETGVRTPILELSQISA